MLWNEVLTKQQKALNIFNAALVTPTYYVFFTSSTIIASAVLFQGFHGTTTQIIDVVMGFLTICSGVVLLQLAKSAKDVPDTKVLTGEMDQIRTVAEQEEHEYEPRADTMRGAAGLIRAISTSRTKKEAEEAKRIHEERMEPIGENEVVEWDGLRRRKTVSTQHSGSIHRPRTAHPPLGMSSFPDEDNISEPDSEVHPGFFGRIGRSMRSRPSTGRQRGHSPVPMDSVTADKLDEEQPEHVYGLPPGLQKAHDTEYDNTAYKTPIAGGSSSTHIQWAGQSPDRERADSQSSSLAPPRVPPHSRDGSGGARRQFSFQNVMPWRHKSGAGNDDDNRPISRGAMSFVSRSSSQNYPTGNTTTEEERLGLVHGDSSKKLPKFDEEDERGVDDRRSSDEWQAASGSAGSSPQQISTSGDLGPRRTRDTFTDDDLYSQPLRDPRDDSPSGGGRGGRAFV